MTAIFPSCLIWESSLPGAYFRMGTFRNRFDTPSQAARDSLAAHVEAATDKTAERIQPCHDLERGVTSTPSPRSPPPTEAPSPGSTIGSTPPVPLQDQAPSPLQYEQLLATQAA